MKVITFGCRINTYESALMSKFADDMDNVIVINTCAVTAEAERQCRQTIRKLKKENPSVRIFVAGCAAQLNPDAYLSMPEVDKVLGNLDKLKKENFICPDKKIVSDVMHTDFDIPTVTEFDGKTRAFLQVQQGCNHHCTFCVVHFVRGRNKGVEPDRVIKQAKQMVKNGYCEIVLTGVDLTSYPYDLADLTERLLTEVDGLKRLRLGSLDPAGVSEKMISLFGRYENLMPHVHFSTQAGSNDVLKKMARRHTREDVLRVVDDLRKVRPDIVFGSDFITGFPTETEEMFHQTMDLVKQTGMILLHVFPFSERPLTPSVKLTPVVPMEIRRQRAALLRELGKNQLDAYLKTQVGKKSVVLVEKKGFGFNEHYIHTVVDENAPVGRFVEIVNKEVKDGTLVG